MDTGYGQQAPESCTLPVEWTALNAADMIRHRMAQEPPRFRMSTIKREPGRSMDPNRRKDVWRSARKKEWWRITRKKKKRCCGAKHRTQRLTILNLFRYHNECLRSVNVKKRDNYKRTIVLNLLLSLSFCVFKLCDICVGGAIPLFTLFMFCE